jgi:hypothetical protein
MEAAIKSLTQVAIKAERGREVRGAMVGSCSDEVTLEQGSEGLWRSGGGKHQAIRARELKEAVCGVPGVLMAV